MAPQDLFNQLLTAFGTLIGINQLTPDEDGLCTLCLNETYFLNLACRDNGDLIVHTALGSVDPQHRADVFADLLAENLFPESMDLSFSWHKTRQRVELTARTPLRNLDAPLLSTFLERFMEITTYWTQRLADTSSDENPAPSRPTAVTAEAPPPAPAPAQSAGPNNTFTANMFNPSFMA